MRSNVLLVVLCVMSVSLAVRSGESPAAMPPNAALQYWKAFALMNLSAEEKERLFGLRAGEQLPDELRKRLEQPLLFLSRGAEIGRCDWGVDLSRDGADALLPHISKCRELARVALVAAHHHFQKRETEKGISIIFDVLALAAHISGGDGTLISKLVEISIGSMALESLAFELPLIPQPKLQALLSRLDALPPTRSFADCVRTERVMVDFLFNQTDIGAKFKALGVDLLAESLDTPEKQAAEKKKLIGLYESIERLHRLPYAEYLAARSEVDRQIKEAGAIASKFIPVLDHARWSTEVYNAKRPMIRAGALYVLEGEAGLKKVQDPHGEGAFAVVKNVPEAGAAGFALKSKLKSPENESPIMNFGVPPALLKKKRAEKSKESAAIF